MQNAFNRRKETLLFSGDAHRVLTHCTDGNTIDTTIGAVTVQITQSGVVGAIESLVPLIHTPPAPASTITCP